MPDTRRRGTRTHIALAVFLGLVTAFGVGVELAHSQTKEVEALIEQYIKLEKQGRYSEAIPLAQRALAIFEKSLGPDHPNVAASLNNLAELYLNQGRYADAVPLFKRSLAIKEKTLGPDHPKVASSLNSLAVLYARQGRYADAEPLFKRSLAIREKSLGPDHPNVGASLGELAGLYNKQGRYADADPLFKRSLAILEKSRGPNDPEVAALLNNFAGLYGNQGRYADVEPLYKRSLAIFEKSLGPDHPNVAAPLSGLAVLYARQGRYADAVPLYKRSLAILEKSFGPCRGSGLDLDVIASRRGVWHQFRNNTTGLGNHPTWRHRHHPAGLRAARLKTIKIGLRPIVIFVVFDAKPGDFGINRSGDLFLRLLDLGAPLLARTDDVKCTPRKHAGDGIEVRRVNIAANPRRLKWNRPTSAECVRHLWPVTKSGDA
jgi:tetratricopeptide (TPR) repeat protein